MGAFGLFVALTTSARTTHRINPDATAFFIWVFAFLAAGAMTFDRFSGERERKTLDFLLGFGVTKVPVALSKIAGAVVAALLLTLGYLGANAITHAFFVPSSELLELGRFFGPAWLLFATYALAAQVFSVMARSSKIALAIFFGVGMVLRPKLWELLTSGICSLLGLTEGARRIIRLLGPEFSFASLSRVGGQRSGPIAALPGTPMEALLCQAALLAICTVTILWVFSRQEERSYGE
jgi:ABC-type transport system involved in multi-copper enzyme maturation permease subunit